VAAEFTGQTLAMGTMEQSTRGSLAQDLLSGRRLKLETLNGTVVRLGRAHALAVPVNWTIYAALRPFSDGTPQIRKPGARRGAGILSHDEVQRRQRLCSLLSAWIILSSLFATSR
jgi:hypothetical protein